MKRVLSLIIQGKPYLADAEVQSLFEVDEGIFTPDCESNLLPTHERAAMIEQKRENAGGLLLNASQRAVLAELERLLIELKFPKSNDRHGQRTKEEAGDAGKL
jgi:acetylglutamate synthase